MYFTGIGTVANMLLIIVGSLIGLFFGKHFPEKIKKILIQTVGLSVIFIGISSAISASFSINDDKLIVNFILMIILSLFIGGAIGAFLNLEKHFNKLGEKIQNKLIKKNENSNFTKGFYTATVVFCVGAMAIVGALNDALLADPTILYAKALLDGITSIVFTSTLGFGVIFAAISVGVYQGSITVLAVLLEPLLTEMVIAQMSAIGSLIIVAIGLTILEIKKFQVVNLLPAIFIPLIWYAITLIF